MADDGGISKLQARFAAIPREIKADIAPALDKGAEEMVRTMKALVASDEGELRASIRVEPGRHELSRKIVAGSAAAPQATYLEFGTTEMEAQPFFWPTVRLLRKRINGRIIRAINASAKRNAS